MFVNNTFIINIILIYSLKPTDICYHKLIKQRSISVQYSYISSQMTIYILGGKQNALVLSIRHIYLANIYNLESNKISS